MLMSEAIYNNLEHWENMNPAEILQDIRKLGNSSRADAVEYRKMAGRAYLASIDRLIQALQEMEEEEISTADLIIEVYGESDSLEYMGEMFQVDADVHRAAEKAGLRLDFSRHGNQEELPYVLDYVVRRDHEVL